MRNLLAFALAALWLAPLASAQDKKSEPAAPKAAAEDTLAVKLDKEPETAKAAEIVFYADKKVKDEVKYKGYKHGSLDGYEKVAAREKIFDQGWEQNCQKDPSCAKALEAAKPDSAAQAKPKENIKESIKRLAKKIAFLKAAKRALKAQADEAKGRSDKAGEAKIEAAKKLVEADHAKAVEEAKQKNEILKIKIFDLKDSTQQP